MNIAKRIMLFVGVNILIVSTISILTSMFGLQPYLTNKGINYTSLLIFCTIWGFGGAFISLLISRKMAKWTMGVKLIDQNENNQKLKFVYKIVQNLASKSNIRVMPEVGYYESDDINAFATGPSKNKALVAVSTGLLDKMTDDEIEGVLAHEMAHITNGDMVTMTLIQGVVNVFVMFLARILANIASQFVDEEKRTMVQFGVTIALELLLGLLGMMVVSAFSRYREYRADEGGALLSSNKKMILALQSIKKNIYFNSGDEEQDNQPALASLKISGRANKFTKLFSTHPDLDDRIARLRARSIG